MFVLPIYWLRHLVKVFLLPVRFPTSSVMGVLVLGCADPVFYLYNCPICSNSFLQKKYEV